MELDSHKLLAGAGTPADATNFNEYIQKNLKLYELNNDVKLSAHSAANFIRKEVNVTHLFLSMHYNISLSCLLCDTARHCSKKRTISDQHLTSWL